jgi:hypothetical protein
MTRLGRKIVGAPHQSAPAPHRYLFRCERKPWIERAALDRDGGRYSWRSHYFSPKSSYDSSDRFTMDHFRLRQSMTLTTSFFCSRQYKKCKLDTNKSQQVIYFQN